MQKDWTFDILRKLHNKNGSKQSTTLKNLTVSSIYKHLVMMTIGNRSSSWSKMLSWGMWRKSYVIWGERRRKEGKGGGGKESDRLHSKMPSQEKNCKRNSGNQKATGWYILRAKIFKTYQSQNLYTKKLSFKNGDEGWRDISTSKGICHKAQQPKFALRDPKGGKKEPSRGNCPNYHPPHTYTQACAHIPNINKNKEMKIFNEDEHVFG